MSPHRCRLHHRPHAVRRLYPRVIFALLYLALYHETKASCTALADSRTLRTTTDASGSISWVRGGSGSGGGGTGSSYHPASRGHEGAEQQLPGLLKQRHHDDDGEGEECEAGGDGGDGALSEREARRVRGGTGGSVHCLHLLRPLCSGRRRATTGQTTPARALFPRPSTRCRPRPGPTTACAGSIPRSVPGAVVRVRSVCECGSFAVFGCCPIERDLMRLASTLRVIRHVDRPYAVPPLKCPLPRVSSHTNALSHERPRPLTSPVPSLEGNVVE